DRLAAADAWSSLPWVWAPQAVPVPVWRGPRSGSRLPPRGGALPGARFFCLPLFPPRGPPRPGRRDLGGPRARAPPPPRWERAQPQDLEVALVVQAGAGVEPAAAPDDHDHDLLLEIDLGQLVRDLPGAPQVLEGLGAGDDLRRPLAQVLVLDRPLPLAGQLDL